jgi:phosphomannomutase
MRLKFGTDGWRDIMGEDFTFSAVAVVGTALGKYVSQTAGGRSVLIGYDNRRDSERYAAITAGELKASGLHVILSREPIPTPVLAVAVRKHQAAGAVMITASHNPPVFNGLKFMPDYAGPALPDVTAAIEAHIADATTPGLPVVDAESLGRSCTGDLAAGYEEAITNVLAPASSLAGLKVVVDAMHGVGASYLPRLLKKAGAEVALLRGNRDPEFGGGNPEPIEAELNLLSDTVRKTGADLGLATDGDADRFGVIDRGGRYLSPNEVLTILYEYLLRTGRRSGGVARTVATTAMLDRVAAAYGQAVTETPVGFKYIGQALRSGVAVFGGNPGHH